MKLVVDANILFSAIITDGYTRELLLKQQHELHMPEYIFEETGKYLNYLCKKSGLSPLELMELLWGILRIANIKIVPSPEYEEYARDSISITPDFGDFPYVALAMKLGCGIWSNDKKLKEQSKVKVYNTEELLSLT